MIPDLQQKFYSASARENDKLVYDSSNFNIAIHVRRGDIMDDPTNPNLVMRYLSNDYFEKVLEQVVEKVKTITDKPVHIYFSHKEKLKITQNLLSTLTFIGVWIWGLWLLSFT